MKKSKGRTAGLVVLVILAALLTAAVWFTAGYYHASEEAAFYLSSGKAVTVETIDEGLFLDGAGTEAALIFYPGARVEYTAYLPMLYHLAEAGADVFLVKMPGNLAILDKDRGEDIRAKYSYERWYLGGHSLGGVMAASLAAETDRTPAGLILLAAYPAKELPDIPVLMLYGSEDRVLNREKMAEAEAFLPEDAVVMEIPGGNHAQFGNYGPQKGDGEAEITAQVQQEVALKMIETQMLIQGED